MVSILPFIVKQFSPSISITENISIFNASKRKQPYYTSSKWSPVWSRENDLFAYDILALI